jgi:hypothetical protein
MPCNQFQRRNRKEKETRDQSNMMSKSREEKKTEKKRITKTAPVPSRRNWVPSSSVQTSTAA